MRVTAIPFPPPTPQTRRLLAYATAKGAIQNFTGGLAQLLAEKGHSGELRGTGSDMDSADPIDECRPRR